MRRLASAGLDENTIVVFTSDHGDNLGSHQLFNKDQLYEESIRIPLIFHWPARLRPRTAKWQVGSLVDLMPTVLSLAGIRTPSSCQGTDLVQVVRGEADVVGENAAFIETSQGPVGMRTLTHLYGIQKERTPAKSLQVSQVSLQVSIPGGIPGGIPGIPGIPGGMESIIDDDHMFFDIPADPYENDNLAKSGKNREAADLLRDRLIRWDRQTPWKEPPAGK
jgi:arylsulfatase A-like enzyme